MMCETLHTGTQFLSTTLAYLDCQGRTIGQYGYGAMADPGSSVSLAMTGMLTIFVALFGIRLLAGYGSEARDVVSGIIRVGLFLALATSWPAWRVLAYDLVTDGPTEIAQQIGRASGLPGSHNDLIDRLQDGDNGIVTLTMFGSGRLTGGIANGGDFGDSATGIALADQTALGSGRTTFLASTAGSFGLLRVGAGILLALAPLMAGLVLFAGTMGIFVGWLRGLAFCMLGGMAFHIIVGTELALLYPWLNDVLAQRQNNVFTPSAPTELFVIALSFGAILAGCLFLIARITFLPAIFNRRSVASNLPQTDALLPILHASRAGRDPMSSRGRAEILADTLADTVRREESRHGPRVWENNGRRDGEPVSTTGSGGPSTNPGQRLGDSWKRSARRSSAVAGRRDQA